MGSKTLEAVFQVILQSPLYIATIVTIILSVSCILYSESKADDFALSLVIVVLVVEVIVMQDWFVYIIEKAFCPEDVFCRIPTKKSKLAALTIDDVPWAESSPSSFEQILDVLKENNVKATLMVMSGFDLEHDQGGMKPDERARCRKLLERAVAEGHELGNHMQLETPAIALTPQEFELAFDHCENLLCEMAGGKEVWKEKKLNWFRPASALWTQHMLQYVGKKGYKTAITSCYPHDVRSFAHRLNVRYLTNRVRPGAIIVVHDRWHTPATLKAALPVILASGVQLGTLSDLYDAQAAESEGSKKD